MPNETIFNSSTADTTATPPVVTPPTTTQLPPEVSEFVGAGKKYATLDDAIKSVPHAQKHIATIEAELKAAKDELEKRKSAEAVLEEIKNNGFNTSQGTPPVATQIKPEDVQKMVLDTLTAQQAQEVYTKNVNSVMAAFTAKFGQGKEEAEYIRIAQESGLSVADLNKLSATSPSAVFKLAGLDSKLQTTDVKKPNSTINTASLSNNQQDTSTLSAKVSGKGSTKDLVNAWKIAGQKVGKTY